MKHRKKADLPTRICQTCGRPFTWRKKWSRDWDNVKYCSDACRGKRPKGPDIAPSRFSPDENKG
ncbi:MAG: DUF2256 domain-containing protein [Candidatus Sumerlaeia bacterium]|nr:DUF2256 domain-containing protein [Candidatus Sumerlaeia bacterium]